MKFTVDGKAFQQQLQAVSKVVNAKNSLNILDNFLLQIEGDVLSIMGSDQENSLVARMTVTECDGDGIVAIPARKLLEVTKEVNNQPVTISVRDDMQVKLQFQNGFFEFMGVPGQTLYAEKERTPFRLSGVGTQRVDFDVHVAARLAIPAERLNQFTQFHG